ncbi:hypothetical protein BSSC8_36480 [Bacillus subtilis subsp. subtilis str. SC-8]|nr:hypothetical protein ABU16_1697 [Bacillus subtilis]EHA29368.1 hypothetical protein BSSC8_36480 [Bacillus subtilis subsp. subtilis str. SC-8]
MKWGEQELGKVLLIANYICNVIQMVLGKQLIQLLEMHHTVKN